MRHFAGLVYIALALPSLALASDTKPPQDLDFYLRKAGAFEHFANPLACPNSEKINFEFLGVEKAAAGKTYNSAQACDLIGEYSKHVFEGVGKFWPLRYRLGLVLQVKDAKENYNASFNGNLDNPHRHPYLTFIFVEGIPTAPQRFVWSHEYGHAVLDQYVRDVLNKEFNLDQIIQRASSAEFSVGFDKQNSTLSGKIDDLSDKARKLADKSYKLSQRTNELSQQVSDLTQLKNGMLNESYEIERMEHTISSAHAEIKNAYMTIRNEQGHLDNYPEGKKIIEPSLAEIEPDSFKLNLKSLFPPNQKRIESSLSIIEKKKSEIAKFESEAKRKKAGLEPRLQQVELDLAKAQTTKVPLDSERTAVEEARKQLGHKISALKIEQAIVKHEQLRRLGISALPGIETMSFAHEFFADLFAAIYHDQPNAIGDAFASILGVEGKQEGERFDLRRFAPLHPKKIRVEEWTVSNSPHEFFAPVRAGLGPDTIRAINRSGKGKVFLERTLDLITQQIIEYTFHPRPEKMSSLDHHMARVSATQNSAELKTYLENVKTTNSLSSGLLSIHDLIQYCEQNYLPCRKLLLEQLAKKQDGIFQPTVDVREANRSLLQGMRTILKDLGVQ